MLLSFYQHAGKFNYIGIVEPIVHMIPKVLPRVLDDIMRQELMTDTFES